MVQLITASQNINCISCGRQFVVNPTKTTVPQSIKQLIDRLLLERISLRGIARVTQVSWSWLQDYVNPQLARTPYQVKVSGKLPGKLRVFRVNGDKFI